MSADAPAGEATYVLRVERVRESIDRLLDRDTHQHFIGYLFLRGVAAQRGWTTGLTPEWSKLGHLLDVPGGPPDRPYLRPFWKGKRESQQEWLNQNLAGSFSPSSIRRTALAQVVDFDSHGRFSLRDGHAELALDHLLYGERMQALPLAVFLFRDYGLIAATPPEPTDLVALFRDEYGYDEEHVDEFATLYDDSVPGNGASWVEPAAGE